MKEYKDCNITFKERPEPLEYYGRNGFGKFLGLDLWNNAGRIRFSPVNSTGRSTSCMMDVPYEALPELVEYLVSVINQSTPKPLDD